MLKPRDLGFKNLILLFLHIIWITILVSSLLESAWNQSCDESKTPRPFKSNLLVDMINVSDVILFDWWAVKSAESWLTSSGFSTCSAWCHTPSRDLFPIIPKINYSHWLVFLKTCLNKSYFHFDNTQTRWCLPVGYISCCSNSLLYIVVVFSLG